MSLTDPPVLGVTVSLRCLALGLRPSASDHRTTTYRQTALFYGCRNPLRNSLEVLRCRPAVSVYMSTAQRSESLLCYKSFEAQQPSNAAVIRRYPHAKHGHRYRPQAPETMVKRSLATAFRDPLEGDGEGSRHPVGQISVSETPLVVAWYVSPW